VRYDRTDSERLTDNAVLLHLWAGAQIMANSDAGDRLKLTKLAYLAADRLYWSGVKALHLPFFRYTYGPFSRGLYTHWDDLTGSGHMVEEERFRVTERGRLLAESFASEVLDDPANAAVKSALSNIIAEFGVLETGALLDTVYAMHVRCTGLPGLSRVRDIPMNTDMLGILDEAEANAVLRVGPGWEATLELAFHPDALANLQAGIADTHAGRAYGWDALVAPV
jgi:hypothetical protein